jgi:cell division septation protein DedD
VKERLTGAIILVALLVLLVPELLTGPVRSAPRSPVAASSAEEPPFRSITINMADDARNRGATAASGPEQPTPLPAPAAQAAPQPSTPPLASPPAVASAPQASGTAAPPPAAHSAPPASAGAAGAAGAFMVQLGSFASRQNAERLAQQLRAQGFTASVSQGSGARHLYRVRAGPAHDHGAAVQLAQQLSAAGHSGSIVPR